MTELQRLTNFMNRVNLRHPDDVPIDNSARYLRDFYEVTKEQQTDLVNAVPNGYTFPDFEQRGIITLDMSDNTFRFHSGRESSEIQSPYRDIITGRIDHDSIQPERVTIPIDIHNSLETNIPSSSYTRMNNLESLTSDLSSLYRDSEDIEINYDWQELLEKF